MRFHTTYTAPELLCELPIGALLICHLPELASCVLMLANAGESQPAPKLPDASYPVVVLGCGASEGEPGYQQTGALLRVTGAAPVVRLQQVGDTNLQTTDGLLSAVEWRLLR